MLNSCKYANDAWIFRINAKIRFFFFFVSSAFTILIFKSSRCYIIRHPCWSYCPNTHFVRYHRFPTPFFTVTLFIILSVYFVLPVVHFYSFSIPSIPCTYLFYPFTIFLPALSGLRPFPTLAGSRPLFPQWSHHVYPQFLPGGHPAHRHPHTHCKLDCSQHINNNTLTHTRIASYHRAHAGNTDRPPLECWSPGSWVAWAQVMFRITN